MFTLLALVISMALFYMVSAGVKTSGALKRYRTSLDATYGGTELLSKELIGKALAFSNVSSSTNTFPTYLQNSMGTLTSPSVSNCFHIRLTTQRRLWGACAAATSNPKDSPDVSFKLKSASGSQFMVYSQILDTSEWTITSFPGTGQKVTNRIPGNTDVTFVGRGLTKGAVVDRNRPGDLTPHYPYIYKIAIQGERVNSPMEKGNVSVLYAY
jgi:hypothetical protein